MSVLLGHSRFLMGKCIGFMGFLDLCCQYKNWNGIFLALDIKLELGPSVSTLGGYAVWNLGGGIGTSGWIMLRHEGDMWTLCWKLVESFPSSYYITLDCTEGRGLVLSGCTFWGAMADFSLFAFVEGLLFSSHYLTPWKISERFAQLLPFGSRRCWKMALGVMGSSRN